MKIVIQRVKNASVTIENELYSKIDKGILIFLGIDKNDKGHEADWLAEKAYNLRIFEDENGKMNHSCKDINGEVLLVSQFTLYGNCNRGRRPDFTAAALGTKAETLYNQFYLNLKALGVKVECGKFGADMQVDILNDGPVTMIIEKKD